MALITHKVVWGDTLWALGKKYGVDYMEIARINNISNPSLIYVGQVLKIKDDGGAPVKPDPIPKSTTYYVTIQAFGLQSNTDRKIFATWSFTRSNTKDYSVLWEYDTGDNVWFIGKDGTEQNQQSIYDAPSNAKRVRVKIKPNSETKTVNGTETNYWNGGWCTYKEYSFKDAPPKPDAPGTPSVTIDKYKLTAVLENLSEQKGKTIQFQVVKNDSTIFSSGTVNIYTSKAEYSVSVQAGDKYKVRARAIIGNEYSEWSSYTSNYNSIPSPPSSITDCRGTSSTSIYLSWNGVASAENYDIEYTTELKYFESSDQTQTISGITATSYEKTGLESGKQYFFRVRASNSQGKSDWSSIKSVTIGKPPGAPTTWSSSTTVVSGEELTLYWVHNTEDGSNLTYSDLEIIINGNKETHKIKNSSTEDKTVEYSINTSKYVEGTKISWRVRTSGVTMEYGEWSIQRVIDVYAPPTLSLTLRDNSNNSISQLTKFPLVVSGVAGPNTQVPTGYHLTIISNGSYDTTDSIGNYVRVNEGDEVYSKYFDISTMLNTKISANDVDLENNIEYTVRCVVSMNSGLTAEASAIFRVSWTDKIYQPNAEVGVNRDDITAQIRPFCLDENNQPIRGVTLSVYRREFDGSFTEIGSGLINGNNTFVIDPHPSLDFARYRIVATTEDTGAVSFYDVPGYPVGEKSIVIQWAEAWSEFDSSLSDNLSKPAWSGSMLKLPYNVDVSDSVDMDVEMIQYIGRKRPVSYYGTQINETSTWNSDILKSDKDTLYAIRRLAIWTGDVYVREPSGSGYWANIKVSFSQKHKELTIPVTFNITRVEGGM